MNEIYNPHSPQAVGAIGEEIAKQYLKNLGWSISELPDGYESFDIKAEIMGQRSCIIQVKTTKCYAQPFFGLLESSAYSLINTYRRYEDAINNEFGDRYLVFFVGLQTKTNGAIMWAADFSNIEALITTHNADRNGFTYGVDTLKWTADGALRPLILPVELKRIAKSFLAQTNQNLDLGI